MEEQKPLSDSELSEEQKDKYIQALKTRGATNPCARCGAPDEQQGIVQAGAPLNLFRIDEAITGVQERRIETIVMTCLNCGAITLHARALLDNVVWHKVESDNDQ